MTFITPLALALAAFLAAPARAAEPSVSVDTAAMDASVAPCDDFYRYACGGWMKANPIPADQPSWGRFSELVERNRLVLKGILEKAAASPQDDVDRRIGGLYSACMDDGAAEKKGDQPVEGLLKEIDGLSSPAALPALVARLHRSGVDAFFGYGSDQDYKDSAQVIAVLDQGGLGLPDRDYYLKKDAKSVALRKAYVWHVAKTFGLAGDDPAAAARRARLVMRLETALAKASMDRIARREPKNVYHRKERAELAKLAPGFDWEAYFKAAGGPEWKRVNDVSPKFLAAFAKLAATTPLPELKDYLRWHVLSWASRWLDRSFVDENFDFYGRRLTGAKELQPRWKRCVRLVDGELGEDLGRRYVAVAYPPDAKARMDDMVGGIEAALKSDISGIDWMSPETKKKALEKLAAVRNKVGYPVKWRDYSSVRVDPKDLLGSIRSAETFEFLRQLGKIGKPVDHDEWGMTPPTVNAYYDPQLNDINFPAGILQPPFFDRGRSAPGNYGAIGAVIGHELTHGFDDEGRHFGPRGNMKDWWTPADSKSFDERTSCLVDQYGSFDAVDGVKLKGKLTLGENTADNGGIRLALAALEGRKGSADADPAGGFTDRQSFFLGFAQVWCQNVTDAYARLLAQVDPHSPGRWRVDGTLSNMRSFAEAFSCKPGSRMVSPKPCRVW
ncbi:MAG: M13 family metallopeptidase [Elusimicrobia bacterium]|nr:M13 family metallopeptidase [Elusimicrobiota bacterium]